MLSGQWGPILPPQALLFARRAPSIPLSLSNSDVPPPWFSLSRRDPGAAVLYWAPLHQGCFGRGRCQGTCCGKSSSVFIILVNHGLSREERVGGWRWEDSIFVGSTWHPCLWEKAERKLREKVHNPCCFVAYYCTRVRDNSVLFDRKSPSSTLSFRFFEAQPEENLPE